MMIIFRPPLAALAVVGLLLSGCGDDSTPATTTGETGISTGDTGILDPTTSGVDTNQLDSTGDPDTGDTGDSGDSGDTGDTGEEVEPGQTAFGIVGSGTRASSANYTLIYTFGQSTPNQNQHNSSNYSLQGGLIGANGRPPQ